MIRFGAEIREMRPFDEDDIFVLRLKLLVTMAKAHLKGYPLGERRRDAVRDNAQRIFYQALYYLRGGQDPTQAGLKVLSGGSAGLLCQHAQLLAVMSCAFADGKVIEGYRKQAMAETIDHICGFLSEQFHMAELSFFKVA